MIATVPAATGAAPTHNAFCRARQNPQPVMAKVTPLPPRPLPLLRETAGRSLLPVFLPGLLGKHVRHCVVRTLHIHNSGPRMRFAQCTLLVCGSCIVPTTRRLSFLSLGAVSEKHGERGWFLVLNAWLREYSKAPFHILRGRNSGLVFSDEVLRYQMERLRNNCCV